MGRTDPISKCRFKVEIDGLTVAHFQGATGLSAETEVFTHTEGGRNDATVKLAGQGQFGQVTLKRGYAAESTLLGWMRETASLGSRRSAVRKGVSVVVLGDDMTTRLGTFAFDGAWPAKWTIEDLQGDGSDEVIETLVLEHRGMTFTKGGTQRLPGDGSGGGSGGVAARAAAAAAAAAAAFGGGSRAAAAAAAVGGAAAGAVAAGRGAGGAAQAAVAAAEQEARAAVADAERAARAVVASPSTLAAGWSGGAGGTAEVAAVLGGGGAGAGQAAVAAAMAEGQVAAVAAMPPGAAGSGVAGATSARGYARGGAPEAGGAAGGARWSDGVHPTQAAGGFGEPGLPGR